MSYKTVSNAELISAFTSVMEEVDFPLKLKMASVSQYQWYELADKMRDFCDNESEIRDLVNQKIKQEVPVVIPKTGLTSSSQEQVGAILEARHDAIFLALEKVATIISILSIVYCISIITLLVLLWFSILL